MFRFTTYELQFIQAYLTQRLEAVAKVNASSPHVEALTLEINHIETARAAALENVAVLARG